MYMKIMSGIAALTLAPAIFLAASAGYRTVLQFVVCWGAGLLVMQAVRARQFVWASAFTALAIAFNPVAPILYSNMSHRLLAATALGLFVASAFVIKMTSARSAPSIVGPEKHGEFENSW